MSHDNTPPGDGIRLFVGSLPAECSKYELQDVFQTYGEVDHIKMMLPHPRLGLRCAIVVYKHHDAAYDAMQVLDGYYRLFADSPAAIEVRWAHEQRVRQLVRPDDAAEEAEADEELLHKDSGEADMASRDTRTGSDQLFVRNLPAQWRAQEVTQLFSSYGELEHVQVLRPQGVCERRIGFVSFKDPRDAALAIELLDGYYRTSQDGDPGEIITVRWAAGATAGKMAVPSSCLKVGDRSHDEGPRGTAWKLFVENLPRTCTREDVGMVFSTYGDIERIVLMSCDDRSRGKRALVFYRTRAAAVDAIKVLDGQYRMHEDSMPLRVAWARTTKPDDREVSQGPSGGWSLWMFNGMPVYVPVITSWNGPDDAPKDTALEESKGSTKCANPGCKYLVQLMGDAGAYCCGGCWRMRGGGAGAQGGHSDTCERRTALPCGASDVPHAPCGSNVGPGRSGRSGGFEAVAQPIWSGRSGGNRHTGARLAKRPRHGGHSFMTTAGHAWPPRQPAQPMAPQAPQELLEGRRLFVPNLPADITHEALNFVFGEYGTVVDSKIRLEKEFRDNSSAYIDMETSEQAARAVEAFQESHYEIRPGYGKLIVVLAKVR